MFSWSNGRVKKQSKKGNVEDDPDMLNLVMTVTIKNASLKQLIQGMLKWKEQQRDKSISLKKVSHHQRRKIYSYYAKRN